LVIKYDHFKGRSRNYFLCINSHAPPFGAWHHES
jgi:hypothetical protein